MPRSCANTPSRPRRSLRSRCGSRPSAASPSAGPGVYLGLFNGGLRGDVFNERLSNARSPLPGRLQECRRGRSHGTDPGGARQEPLRHLRGLPSGEWQGPAGPVPAARQVASSWSAPRSGSSPSCSRASMARSRLKAPRFNSAAMLAWEGVFNDKKLAAHGYFPAPRISATPPLRFPRRKAVPPALEVDGPRNCQVDRGAAPPDSMPTRPCPAPTPPAAYHRAHHGSRCSRRAKLPEPRQPRRSPGAPATAPPAARRQPGRSSRSPAAPAAPAAARRSDATPELIATGKATYMTLCFVCHQPTGMGLFPRRPAAHQVSPT